MTGYLINFSLYTLAMVGVIFVSLFIFKSVVAGGSTFSKKSTYLKVLDTFKLTPRKTLYVVKAGGEKFLLAGDMERTTLIAKLTGGIEKTVTLNTVEAQPFTEYAESTKEHDFAREFGAFKKEQSLPKLRIDKSEELNSLYGGECMEEFASMLKLKKEEGSKDPMMRGLAKKLNF